MKNKNEKKKNQILGIHLPKVNYQLAAIVLPIPRWPFSPFCGPCTGSSYIG